MAAPDLLQHKTFSMKRIFFTMVAVALMGQMSLQAQDLTKKMDSLSYSLGVLVAQNLKSQGFDNVNSAALAAGIEDVITDKDLKIDAEQANALVQQYMSDKQAEQFAGVKGEGAEFLKQNGMRGNVVTTASGLQYEVLNPGSGAKPTPADKVTVHYHGTLIDGTVFDSSVQRNSPATFGVTQVIQGWVEGLQLMSTGAKYKFFIPYDLAYGERGAGPKIPPFSTLIFEVELIKIN
jgi:FKBP-type peptidyl-prolyl cis-trans isomerase FklB